MPVAKLSLDAQALLVALNSLFPAALRLVDVAQVAQRLPLTMPVAKLSEDKQGFLVAWTLDK